MSSVRQTRRKINESNQINQFLPTHPTPISKLSNFDLKLLLNSIFNLDLNLRGSPI